jgi:ribosomal protein L24
MLDIIVCITQAVSDFPDVETMVLRIAKGYPWCYVVLVASTRLERRFADGSRAPKPKVVISPPARPTSNVKKSEQRKETHTSTAAASLHRQHIPHKPPTMQKVIQRSALAKRNADRRLQKIVEHHEKGQGWSRRNEAQRIRKFNHSLIKDARLARQEDWARGALAPRRDVGDKAETYGSVGIFNMNWAESQEKNKPTWNSIVEGDRVVVTKGREKGKIGVVDLLDDQRGFVKIKGINVGDINIPEWAQQENNSQPMVSMSMPIAIESVKLVYPLPNEATGVPQDVVIDRLERVNEQWDAVKRVWDKGERHPRHKHLDPLARNYRKRRTRPRRRHAAHQRRRGDFPPTPHVPAHAHIRHRRAQIQVLEVPHTARPRVRAEDGSDRRTGREEGGPYQDCAHAAAGAGGYEGEAEGCCREEAHRRAVGQDRRGYFERTREVHAGIEAGGRVGRLAVLVVLLLSGRARSCKNTQDLSIVTCINVKIPPIPHTAPTSQFVMRQERL